MKIKSGFKSSEFFVTLISFIFSGLYLTGVLSDHSQKEELIGIGGHVVESVILIVGQLLIFYRYVKGRSEVKKIVEEENLELIKKENPRKKSIKPKTSPKTKTKSKSLPEPKPKTQKPTKEKKHDN